MEKELKDSLDLIKQVCAVFVGNLEQHNNIQKALFIVEMELSPKEKPNEE